MNSIGFGDLAISYRSLLQNFQVKSDLDRLGQEISSGQKADLKTATAGDLIGFAGIETTLSNLTAFKINADEAAISAGAIQYSLGLVQDITSDLAPTLLSTTTLSSDSNVDALAFGALGKFETVVAALNARVGDRSLFAGAGVDGPAIADAETILAQISIAAAGETTAAGVADTIEDWFDLAGGGFETVGYLGDDQYLGDFRIGTDFRASLKIKADDQDIRNVLKGYAMAALVAEGALNGAPNQRAILLERAGSEMLSAQGNLITLRAKIGTVEATVDQAIAYNLAETQSLEIAKAQILSVDPYKAATEFQAAETRLETLYTITARLSRLNLVDYLR